MIKYMMLINCIKQKVIKTNPTSDFDDKFELISHRGLGTYTAVELGIKVEQKVIKTNPTNNFGDKFELIRRHGLGTYTLVEIEIKV